MRHVPADYPTIQAAINAPGPAPLTIVVAPGVYSESIIISGNVTHIRGVDPLNPASVAETILDGTVMQASVPFANQFQFSGFTIRGGGIHVQVPPIGGTYVISNNVFENCDYGVLANGQANGVLFISDNSFRFCNNGISSDIPNARVTGNSFYQNVVAATGDFLQFEDNSVCENFLTGLAISMATHGEGSYARLVRRNHFSDNLGPAVEAQFTLPIRLTDSYIVNNDSGVVMNGGMAIHNCTIAANSGIGIAMLDIGDSVTNSIVYANGVAITPADGFGDRVTHCCLTEPVPGAGNFVADPEFVDPAALDYHLTSDSPCINAGPDSYDWSVSPLDFDGDLRVRLGRIDIGADETPYGSPEPPLRGDMNNDGQLNGLDVQEFVQALLGS